MTFSQFGAGLTGALVFAFSASASLATLSPVADTFTIFNPDGTVFRSASLTVAQEHGGATEVIAVSFESVPDTTGALVPLLKVNAGINLLLKPATSQSPPGGFSLPPGTMASDAWGIFTLSSSVPGAFFLNFVTGNAIDRIGLPGEFAAVEGAPINFIDQSATHIYDATSSLSAQAMAAGYTATFQDKIPDASSTLPLFGLAVLGIGWLRRKL